MSDQTTPFWSGTKALITFSVPVTIALSIGTGGYYTAEYYKQRKDGLTFSRHDMHNGQVAIVATTSDDLARIKSVLKLTVAHSPTASEYRVKRYIIGNLAQK